MIPQVYCEGVPCRCGACPWQDAPAYKQAALERTLGAWETPATDGLDVARDAADLLWYISQEHGQ